MPPAPEFRTAEIQDPLPGMKLGSQRRLWPRSLRPGAIPRHRRVFRQHFVRETVDIGKCVPWARLNPTPYAITVCASPVHSRMHLLVERSFAWMSRDRRLNTIFERSNEHLIAFVAIAFISMLSRRLKRVVVEELSA